VSDPRTCTRCGTPDLTQACPVCTLEWENRREAVEMSPEERLAEFQSWGPVLEIDFDKLQQRIEELVGRPVWTHELGTSGVAYLEHEILTAQHPSLDGVLAKIPADKQVIVVDASGSGSA
jgi:uncharacterized Zn finger protein (UPF0148 family)